MCYMKTFRGWIRLDADAAQSMEDSDGQFQEWHGGCSLEEGLANEICSNLGSLLRGRIEVRVVEDDKVIPALK
jgi:hypothetical protein